MKRKFLILTLCFTIIFSSINFSFAYDDISIYDDIDVCSIQPLFLPSLVLAPEVIATIATIAVGCGIVLTSSDDIYDVARLVYENYRGQKEDIEKIFLSTCSIASNGVVKVGKEFLDICKNAFDNAFLGINYNSLEFSSRVGVYYFSPTSSKFFKVPGYILDLDFSSSKVGDIIDYNDYIKLQISAFHSNGNVTFNIILNDDKVFNSALTIWNTVEKIKFYIDKNTSYLTCSAYISSTNQTLSWNTSISMGVDYSIPYNGTYDWDNNIGSSINEDGSVGVYVPGNAGSLVGQGVGSTVNNGVNNPAYDLPLGGVVSLPTVNNPSLEIGDSITIPSFGVENPPTDIPDVENPPVGVIPPFPSFGDSLDFSPMYLTNINEKFPFSLPWDIGRLIEKFDIDPKAPIFKVPIVTSEIELDLTIFDEWANIGRFFILIGFALSLILISTKLLG